MSDALDLSKLAEVKKVDNNFEVVEIFAVYDVKGEKYDIPFFAHNELFAKRRFLMMSKEESILKNFLNDFNLVNLGGFNIITGEIKPLNKIVLEGKQIRKENEKDEISNEA